MKLIQVNEDFWVSTDQIRKIEIRRPRETDTTFTKGYVFVYLKPCGNEPVGSGFQKTLGEMWGKTVDEQVENFTTEANRPEDFGLASEMG